MKALIKYHSYKREEVHDIFSPETRFVPQGGPWGQSGIVKVPDRDGDYVFFVTFGQSQADHSFDEYITENGILTWQSQPSQTLSERRIRQFIRHDHISNNIYLFLRTERRTKEYTYLGRLAYVDHDLERQNPVYFKWQILDWDIPWHVLQNVNLNLTPNIDLGSAVQVVRETDVETAPPRRVNRKKGKSTRDFRGRFVDYAENEKDNRDLGLAGEMFILECEMKYLREIGREDLASKIVHIPEKEGDGVGYDIRSFELTGEPKYIEVKTTSGGANTPFMISANELAFSKANPNRYHVYRVFEFDFSTKLGRFYKIKGDLSEHFTLLPALYSASRFFTEEE